MANIKVARGLTALREATYNTDAGVAVTNGVEFVEATVRLQDTYDGQRADVNHGSAGALSPTLSRGRFGEITIRGEQKGPGVTYTDALTQLPWYHIVLGCAVSGVVSGGDLTLSPVRPDKSGSFTLGFYSGDHYYKFTGCRGNMKFTGEAANRGFWEFTGMGVLAKDYPTQVALPSITYANQADMPSVFISGSASIGAWTPVIRGYEFNYNNEITARLDGNASTGHSGFQLTQRNVSWAFPGESVSLGTYNPFSTSASGTTAALSLSHGSATGNTAVFAMSKASIRPPELADESGLLMWNVGGTGHVTSGNDEITVTLS